MGREEWEFKRLDPAVIHMLVISGSAIGMRQNWCEFWSRVARVQSEYIRLPI